MPGTSASTTDRRRFCPHCGSELEPVRGTLFERERVLGWKPCRCPCAVAERAARLEKARAAERAERADALRRAAERAGVMPRYLGAEHPEAARVSDDALEGRGTYVWGPVGTGKTHLASAAALLLLQGDAKVRVASMASVLDRVRRSFGTPDDPMAPYRSVRVLVLDDLGKESPTDWALERLFSLADERCARMLPTIVTTQYRPSDLIARLAKNGGYDTAVAIVSRLRQGARTVETRGADRRLGATA